MIFITSWDDGHPLDERLAELLAAHGLKGTFYVPIRNCEGMSVLSPEAMRRMDGSFEIGSHTLEHAYLTGLLPSECERQVYEGKTQLEQILSHNVNGFCYPGGEFNSRVRQIVVNAGFKYARTIENFRIDRGSDRYAIPTTLQLFPHSRMVLLRNYLRYGGYIKRFSALRLILTGLNYWNSLTQFLEASAETDNIIHLWGHSWEIDKHGLWSKLQTLLSIVAEIKPRVCTVSELISESEPVI